MKDLIDRQAAIETLDIGRELLRRVLDDTNVAGVERAKYEWGLGLIESYISDMKELPSAQTEREKGEWIKKISKKKKDKEYIGYTPYWHCSECGKRYEPALANTIINYCYNCGADIRGANDG